MSAGTDVGRSFIVSRTQSMFVTLSASDVEDQLFAGDDAETSARIISEHSPESSWSTEDIDVTEVTR